MALPKKFVPIPRVQRLEQFPQCVGCQGPLDGFARMGSVIRGLRFITVESTEVDSNGNEYEVLKRAQFWKRKRGLICMTCQGDYRTVTRKRRIGESDLYETETIPFVKVDPMLVRPNETEGKKQFKVLNTRITQ